MPHKSSKVQTLEFEGELFSLQKETRWNRIFEATGGRKQLRRSRFQDGSASITLSQLRSEWELWSETEKRDFCEAIGWLAEPERSEILGFLVEIADFRFLSNSASMIARCLPPQISVPWLLACIRDSEPGKGSNFIQALAFIGAPEAKGIIQERLNLLWAHSGLLEPAEFMNWIAGETVYCIKHLLELGQLASTFHEKVGLLAHHPCARVRQMFEWNLGKFFEDFNTGNQQPSH